MLCHVKSPLIAVIKPHRACSSVSEDWRYPFLPTARKVLEGVNLRSLLDDYFYAEARDLALHRLEMAASKGKIEVEGPPTNDETDVILSFLISRLILSSSGNQALINYAALSEARRAESFLNQETDDNLVEIVNSLDNINVKKVGSKFNLNFIDYVRAASKLRDGNWKLSNRGVSNGIVELDRETLVRLMREVIRQHLEEIPEAPPEIKEHFNGRIKDIKLNINKTFKGRIAGLEGIIAEREAEALKEFGEFDLSKAPPCFNKNLADLQTGVNLPHPSRFFITTFLSSLKQDPEAVMRLFATAPDFKESFTRYQVEHISGKTSSTQYDTPACDTLVSTGVCPGPNSLCRLIKHPLSYYRVMAEGEKTVQNRIERILLATIGEETYPKDLIDINTSYFKDYNFSFPSKLNRKRIREAYNSSDISLVSAKIRRLSHRTSIIDSEVEERKIWIPKSTLAISEKGSSNSYDCFAVTDWKIGLKLSKSFGGSKEIDLILQPHKVELRFNESRKLFLILGVAEES